NLPNPTAQNSSLRQQFLPLPARKLLECNDMRMSIQGIPGASDRPANPLNRKRRKTIHDDCSLQIFASRPSPWLRWTVPERVDLRSGFPNGVCALDLEEQSQC